MREIKYTCDCCGAVHMEPKDGYMSNSKWETIRLKTSEYNENTYHVCPKCQPKLGISVQKGVQKKKEDIGDRLLDILQEIVQMQGGGQ